MLNLDKLFLAPTSELSNLRDRIDAELKRRGNGEIPDPLKCAVCGKEIVGDSYEISENSRACDFCVKLNEQLQQDVNDGSRKVAVEGRPSTVSLSKPCVRLSPHMETFQLSVAIYALGYDNHFYFIPYS